MKRRPRSGWTVAVLVFLSAHLLWGLGRVPGKVWGKRLQEIEEYQAETAAGYINGEAAVVGRRLFLLGSAHRSEDEGREGRRGQVRSGCRGPQGAGRQAQAPKAAAPQAEEAGQFQKLIFLM